MVYDYGCGAIPNKYIIYYYAVFDNVTSHGVDYFSSRVSSSVTQVLLLHVEKQAGLLAADDGSGCSQASSWYTILL